MASACLTRQGPRQHSLPSDLMVQHADPNVILADKGYGSDAIRESSRPRRHARDPFQKNREIQHTVNRPLKQAAPCGPNRAYAVFRS